MTRLPIASSKWSKRNREIDIMMSENERERERIDVIVIVTFEMSMGALLEMLRRDKCSFAGGVTPAIDAATDG